MVQTTGKKAAGTKKTVMKQESLEDAAYVGAYVNRNGTEGEGVALITILMPDETCGMFIMPTSQHVIWMGSTTYRVSGTKVYFTIQSVPDGKGGMRKVGQGEENFFEAKLDLGVKLVQGDNVFDFITSNVDYWKKNNWRSLGEARELEGQKDFDAAHEIRKIMLESINKFGNDLGW